MKTSSICALLATFALAVSANGHAETLLIDRTKEVPPQAAPVRGQTAAEVEARFGAPQQKMEPRGGQKQ